MWRLALAGDDGALLAAAELLLADPADLDYEGHRSRAFGLALGGRVDQALAQLTQGWTDAWPSPHVYAADVARVRYLAGDDAQALRALRHAARGADGIDLRVVELAVLVVRRSPRLWRAAVRAAAAGGTVRQRVGGVATVLRTRLARADGEPQPGIRSTILPS
jgi:hypothetical protein